LVTSVSSVSRSDRLTDPPVTVLGQYDGLTGDSGQCAAPGHSADRCGGQETAVMCRADGRYRAC
jgi:hypothetical protein